MSKFINAFQQGLAAASTSRANRAEVRGVLKKLSDEVLQGSEGKVRISECKLICQTKLNLNAIEDAIELKTRPHHYSAICAENPHVRDSLVELARWNPAEDGYPCVLEFDAQVFTCNDRLALEQALGEMLSCNENGKKISRLIRMEPTHGESANSARLARAIRRQERRSAAAPTPQAIPAAAPREERKPRAEAAETKGKVVQRRRVPRLVINW